MVSLVLLRAFVCLLPNEWAAHAFFKLASAAPMSSSGFAAATDAPARITRAELSSGAFSGWSKKSAIRSVYALHPVATLNVAPWYSSCSGDPNGVPAFRQ